MHAGKPRGSTLIVVLFILMLLLVMGLGLITRARLGYQTGASGAALAAARELAFAGLEDFRAKAARDAGFPIVIGDNSEPVTYSEEIRDRSGQLRGTYRLVVMADKADAPHFVYQLESTGLVGAAQYVVTGYLENRPGMRWLGFEQGQSGF